MHKQKKRIEKFLTTKDTFEQKFYKFCYFQCTTPRHPIQIQRVQESDTQPEQLKILRLIKCLFRQQHISQKHFVLLPAGGCRLQPAQHG